MAFFTLLSPDRFGEEWEAYKGENEVLEEVSRW